MLPVVCNWKMIDFDGGFFLLDIRKHLSALVCFRVENFKWGLTYFKQSLYIVIDCYFIIFLNFRYTLLHVLEFDSTRKRMSVIVKSPQGFDIIWYRSNFFRRNNPLGMLEKKFLEQRLWYFAGFFPCSSNIRYQVTLSTSKLSLP